jgi:hypothetical protein
VSMLIPLTLLSFISRDPKIVTDSITAWKTFLMERFNSVTRKLDPSLTSEAARYDRADFLKTLLELGSEIPFVPQVRNPKIRKILDAGERAEEIAKSIISVIKESPEIHANDEFLRAIKTTIRTNILKKYRFDAAEMTRDFGLGSKTLFESLTPHFFREAIGHRRAANEFVRSQANSIIAQISGGENLSPNEAILIENNALQNQEFSLILNTTLDPKRPRNKPQPQESQNLQNRHSINQIHNL